MNKFCIKLIESYQKKTEDKPHRCRYYPSCSNYGLIAYKRYNFFKASFLTFFRLIRCNPLSKGGYNPVPEKKAKFYNLKDNIYILEYKENTDRPNLIYINNGNNSIIIDSGNSKKHVKYFYKKIKKHKLPLPKYSIITHNHWDHSFGLAYTNTTSIGLEKTNEILLYQKEKLERISIMRLFYDKDIPLFCKDHLLLEYKHKKNKIKITSLDITFENNYRLNDLSLFTFPSNHTIDTLVVLDNKNKVLFLGDALCGKIVDFDFINDEEIIKEQISLLKELDFEIAVESHSNPINKSELINKLRTKIKL